MFEGVDTNINIIMAIHNLVTWITVKPADQNPIIGQYCHVILGLVNKTIQIYVIIGTAVRQLYNKMLWMDFQP